MASLSDGRPLILSLFACVPKGGWATWATRTSNDSEALVEVGDAVDLVNGIDGDMAGEDTSAAEYDGVRTTSKGPPAQADVRDDATGAVSHNIDTAACDEGINTESSKTVGEFSDKLIKHLAAERIPIPKKGKGSDSEKRNAGQHTPFDGSDMTSKAMRRAATRNLDGQRDKMKTDDSKKLSSPSSGCHHFAGYLYGGALALKLGYPTAGAFAGMGCGVITTFCANSQSFFSQAHG